MKISVEQTPRQKISPYVLEHVDSVSIVHLPKNRLSETLHTIADLQRQNKNIKIIPHIAARSLKSKEELFSNCDKFAEMGIKDVLIIGGGTKTGYCYSSAFGVYEDILNENYKFNMMCGVYPQNETSTEVDDNKYSKFTRGITQVCLSCRLLNQFDNRTIVGVPSNCSAKELIRFIKLCGVARSIREAIPNIVGAKYISFSGFNTAKFVGDLSGDRDIHIFNFGNLEKTVRSLQKLL